MNISFPVDVHCYAVCRNTPDGSVEDADICYNITDALTLLAYILMARQAYKCFQNIQEKFEVSDDDIPRTKTDVTELNDYGMRG